MGDGSGDAAARAGRETGAKSLAMAADAPKASTAAGSAPFLWASRVLTHAPASLSSLAPKSNGAPRALWEAERDSVASRSTPSVGRRRPSALPTSQTTKESRSRSSQGCAARARRGPRLPESAARAARARRSAVHEVRGRGVAVRVDLPRLRSARVVARRKARDGTVADDRRHPRGSGGSDVLAHRAPRWWSPARPAGAKLGRGASELAPARARWLPPRAIYCSPRLAVPCARSSSAPPTSLEHDVPKVP